MKALAGMLAGAFLVLGGCAADDGSDAGTGGGSRAQGPLPSPEDYATELVTETDAVRTSEGLPALERLGCADREAARRADRLRGRRLEHLPLRGFVDACAPGRRAAENLAASDRPAAEVVAAWMDSPGHRNNIVDPGLTHTGVGCARDGDELVCVQLFLGED